MDKRRGILEKTDLHLALRDRCVIVTAFLYTWLIRRRRRSMEAGIWSITPRGEAQWLVIHADRWSVSASVTLRLQVSHSQMKVVHLAHMIKHNNEEMQPMSSSFLYSRYLHKRGGKLF